MLVQRSISQAACSLIACSLSVWVKNWLVRLFFLGYAYWCRIVWMWYGEPVRPSRLAGSFASSFVILTSVSPVLCSCKSILRLLDASHAPPLLGFRDGQDGHPSEGVLKMELFCRQHFCLCNAWCCNCDRMTQMCPQNGTSILCGIYLPLLKFQPNKGWQGFDSENSSRRVLKNTIISNHAFKMFNALSKFRQAASQFKWNAIVCT